MLDMSVLRERLAALEHEQWMAWSQDIARTEVITPARLERWEALWVPYADLTDAQKDQDREWADRVLALMKIDMNAVGYQPIYARLVPTDPPSGGSGVPHV